MLCRREEDIGLIAVSMLDTKELKLDMIDPVEDVALASGAIASGSFCGEAGAESEFTL